MDSARSVGQRVARGAGALLLADLITGLVGFSVITLGFLWYFSISWIQLVGEAHARGRSFGTTTQLGLAYFGELVTLPMLGVTIYLALRAYRYPWTLFRSARAAPSSSPSRHAGHQDYHCPECSRTFTRLPSWAMHLRVEHGR